MAESKDLLSVLWSGADELRGKMDANEYKTYLLGFKKEQRLLQKGTFMGSYVGVTIRR